MSPVRRVARVVRIAFWIPLLSLLPGVVRAGAAWPSDVPGHVALRPGEHPRLLFRRADLPGLRRRAGTPEGKEILARLGRLLDGKEGRGMPAAYNPVVGPASGDGAGPTGKAPDGMYTFSHAAGYGLLYQLTGEREYAALGRRCMEKALEGVRDRDNRYAFLHPYGALRAGPSLGWTALGYDLCHDGWDEAFRRRIAEAIFEYRGSNKGKVFDLEYLVRGRRHFPASNHWGMQVGGGALALLAVMADPGVDEARARDLLRVSEKSMLRNLSEGFGDGGYFAEGDGTGSMSSHIVFLTALQAWRVAAGKDFVGPRPNAQWAALKWIFGTVPPANHRGRLARGFVARGGYPHNVWARDGISGGAYHAIGYGVLPPDQVPALWWFYRTHLEAWDASQRTPWDTVSPYPHHAVLAFVNTPFGVEPRNPAECIPRAVRDTKHGFYAFRNRWRDENDIVITQLTRRSPARFRHGPDRAMTIQHGGRRETWGAIPARATCWRVASDGSAVVGDGRTFVGIDFSGASGADCMLVMTGPGTPDRAVVTAGGRRYAFKFLGTAPDPRPSGEGDGVTIGRQTVSCPDGTLALGVFASP